MIDILKTNGISGHILTFFRAMTSLVPCTFTSLKAGDAGTDDCLAIWADVAFYAWIFGLSNMQEGMPMINLDQEHIETLKVLNVFLFYF